MEDTITCQDYLKSQHLLEQEALQVLPGDASKCFHSLGRITQQIYSCLTCADQHQKRVGVCYGCFISCHTNHTVVEMFYKRDFQCDCGTSGSPRCNIDAADKSITQNKYSDNFDGVFCKCRKIYDADTEDNVMFQCKICEDWYHDECIGLMAHEDDFEDLICASCALKYPVFNGYALDPNFCVRLCDLEFLSTDIQAPESLDSAVEVPKMERLECRKPATNESTVDGFIFCKEGWIEMLCRCKDCMEMYAIENLSFLFDISAIEPEIDTNVKSIEEQEMLALSSLDHSVAINGYCDVNLGVLAYNRMKSKVFEYLQPFAANGEIVTKDDIYQIFEVIYC